MLSWAPEPGKKMYLILKQITPKSSTLESHYSVMGSGLRCS